MGSSTFNFRQCERRLKKEYESLPDDALDLLDKMLALDPNQRISAKKALLHKWFSTINATENHAANLTIKLPQEYDCHEMWSKEQKRKRRQRDKPEAPFKPEPLGPINQGNSPQAFGAGARGHSAPFNLRHSGSRNASSDTNEKSTFQQIIQANPDITVFNLMQKVSYTTNLAPARLTHLQKVTVHELLLHKSVNELPSVLSTLGVTLNLDSAT